MPSYRKVPRLLLEQMRTADTSTFYVGARRTFGITELASGELQHLGIGWSDSTIAYVPTTLPAADVGRWSKYNIDGRVVVRRDLAKVERLVGGWESPHFGDWGRGSHTHWHTVQAFPRETWYAQRLGILVDVNSVTDAEVTIGFRVDRVFSVDDPHNRDLLLACSLLRENVGAHVSLVPTDLSTEEWLDDQQVDWELLPRGQVTFDAVLKRVGGQPSGPRIREARGRYEAIEQMTPGALIVGHGEFSRYFGFKFRDDLVVLECLDYGNALYVMYDDWEELSHRSRIDLLSDGQANYDRIVHTSGWEERLRQILERKGHQVAPGRPDGG